MIFSCQFGYDLVGSAESVCQMDYDSFGNVISETSAFTPPAPLCQIVSCPDPGHALSVRLLGSRSPDTKWEVGPWLDTSARHSRLWLPERWRLRTVCLRRRRHLLL